MKKLIPVLSLSLFFLTSPVIIDDACAAAANSSTSNSEVAAPKPIVKSLSHGSLYLYTFGNLKLHAYITGDAMTDTNFVLENENGLIAIEAPAFHENITEWSHYVQQLKKPVTDIFFSYHPAANEKWYGKARVRATSHAAQSMTSGGTQALVANLGKAYGDNFATNILPIDTITPSGQVDISGINFQLSDDGEGYSIAIPAINAFYLHMLGADTHSILAGAAHMDAYLAELESIKAAGYTLILSSHHAPETLADVETKIAYVKKTSEIMKESKDKADFIQRMNTAFPNYKGQNYLEMTAGICFKN